MPASTNLGRLKRPAQNRSLERGVEILRAFRPGTDLMGNSELSERTGIAPATVSRLTQTLVRQECWNTKRVSGHTDWLRPY